MKWPADFKVTTFKCIHGDGYICICHHVDAKLNRVAVNSGWSLSKKTGAIWDRAGDIFVKKSHLLGYVELHKKYRGRFATHSYVKQKYRGKGYGSKLYSHAIGYAIKKGYKVGSSYFPSDAARGTWSGKYLNSRYKITKYADGLVFYVQRKKY